MGQKCPEWTRGRSAPLLTPAGCNGKGQNPESPRGSASTTACLLNDLPPPTCLTLSWFVTSTLEHRCGRFSARTR